ncbi:MAG: hypothetical protein ACPG5B_09060 [Chitinophagales bacterium]
MISILKIPYENYSGNLIWIAPYFYPINELEEGLQQLTEKEYWVSLFPQGDGLTFNHPSIIDENEILQDFKIVFPWMNIVLKSSEQKVVKDINLFDEQIVILPLSRFELSENIHTSKFSIFAVGELDIDKIEISTINEILYKDSVSKSIRDQINEVTGIEKSIFKERPLIVMKNKITIEKYINLKHSDDNELIKEYSNQAEEIFDIIRFENCNYLVPELLPARAGLYNDRYSTALVYFPKYKKGFFQAREVELKVFAKGIGLRLDNIDTIKYHRLIVGDLNETGRIAKHALRLNSLIQESDNETMKFVQIMTLLEFIGDPYGFQKFQKIKGRLISVLAKNKTEYHQISQRFKQLTGGNNKDGIRTLIVHVGKRIEELFPDLIVRKELFKELEKYVHLNIRYMINNYELEWERFDELRLDKAEKLQA